MKVELMVQTNSSIILPCVEEGICWETERKGTPGKITFSVVDDGAFAAQEGNPVKLTVDGIPIFYGFIFTLAWENGNTVKVTAYDQMRYLKNKDTYVFKAASASELITMVGNDFGLRLGEIQDTYYVIPSRVEENSTLIDMMQTALDITLTNTKRLYVLYDDAGKLTLKGAEQMQIGLILDAETGESCSYESTIDKDTYNRVKLEYEDEKKSKREIFIAQDKNTMSYWGTFQYYEKISDTVNAQNKADTLLALFNRKTKNLKINRAFGDLRVRAGSMVIVRLNLAGETLNSFMMVEKCSHMFNQNEHTMNLAFSGRGDFVG